MHYIQCDRKAKLMIIDIITKNNKFKILFEKTSVSNPFLSKNEDYEIADANLEFLKKMNIKF